MSRAADGAGTGYNGRMSEPPTEPAVDGGTPVGVARTEQLLKRLRRRDGGHFGLALTVVYGLIALGLWGVTGMGQRWSAPPGWFAALVTFLPHLYATALGLGFVLWTALPDRRSLPVLQVALLVSGGALWGPSWSAKGVETEGEPVRVLSWNLRRLWGGPDDGGDALACALGVLEAEAPDVITLMEVSAQNIEALEEKGGLSCVHHTYRSDQGPKSGGLATCTREGWTLEHGSGQRFVDDEDWFYVFSEVRHGDALFNVLAVHLTPYDYAARRLRTGVQQLAKGDPTPLADLERSSGQVVKGQSDQAAALLHRVRRFEHPTVVAGDFNSTRDAALHTELRRLLVDTFEQGGFGFGGTIDFAGFVPLRIDYVYASPRFSVTTSRVVETGCSDHRPVLSELVLQPAH